MMTNTVNTSLQTLLDKEIQKKNSHHVLLHVQSKDGTVGFQGAVGNATVDSPYFIASITKMYTTTIIMQLVDEGKIDLDAPIGTYLPANMLEKIHVYKGIDYSQQLKVYQLIHQTSGLPDYFEDKRADGGSLINDIKDGKDNYWEIDDVLEMTRNMTPPFEPDANGGKKSHYSDSNYQLLGGIIQAVTEEALSDVYQQRIFDRLGLTDTYLYHYEHLREGTQPLHFYNKDQKLDLPKSMSSFRSDGGLVSTLSDGMRFLQAYFAGELFSPSHFPRMMKQWNGIFFPLQYGYGMFRFQLPRWMTLFRYSPEFIGHSGATGSFAFYTPKEQVFIVGTFNQIDGSNRPVQLMSKVMNALS